MNLNWDSLLEPIFLFILSVLAGTLWVIVPVHSNRDPHPPMANVAPVAQAIVTPVPEAPLESPLAEEIETAQGAISEQIDIVRSKEEKVALSGEELKQLEVQNQQLSLNIQAEQKNLERLRGELEILRKQSGDPNSSAPIAKLSKEIQSEIDSLRRLLQQRQAESAQLVAQLGETKSKSDLAVPYIPKASEADKLPILVELLHNRAVPVNKTGYKMGFGFTSTTATRKWEGESVPEIQKPGSAFMQYLGKINGNKQYLSCLLNSDSYQVFRVVRQLAQQKGIEVGWEPADTTSGELKLYRVRFQNKPSGPSKESPVKLPPILK